MTFSRQFTNTAYDNTYSSQVNTTTQYIFRFSNTGLIHLGLHRNLTAKISFLRRFFASGVNPAMSAAAKTKAQGIINDNAVGMREDPKLGGFIH